MMGETQTQPNNVESRVAAILRDAREHGGGDSALAELRSLARAADAPFAVFDALAQLCFEMGLLDEAAVASEKAIARDSSQASTWHRFGIIQMRRQEPEAARKALEQTVRLQPRSAPALNNLGYVLQHLRLFAAAAECYGQAIGIDPQYPEAHCNLASVLALAGDYENALAHAQCAIELRAGYLNPYLAAAMTEADRGRFEAALAWVGKLPREAQHEPMALMSHAEILVKAGRLEDAIVLFTEAIARQPDAGDAYLSRGAAQAAAGRQSEALDDFGKAATLMPQAAMPLAWKASVLIELARAPEANELYDQARALEPRLPNVLYMRAAAREFHLPNSEITELKDLLADEQVTSTADRMHLHFTLAGAYLRSEEAPKAFPHLHAGNRIKRSMTDYDPVAAERLIASIATRFSATLLEQAAGDASRVPIFVTGIPRSGTTLVEQILASHPLIHGAGELRAITQVTKGLEKKYGRFFPQFAENLTVDDHRSAGREYLAAVGEPPAGKQHIVDKMPANALFAGLIRLALPNARIVHCRRNPFDTCFSCYSILFTGRQDFSYDLSELGRYYRAHDALMAHWQRVLPKESFLEINYEDVVENLEGEARRLIAFCGLEWSDECLRFHESKRPVRTASMLQVRKPLYRDSVGRWRQYRSELGPLFDALGVPVPD